MAINFSGIVGNLASLGFYDFVLPWLLFFAIVLAILNKAKILGENSRINSLISAVLAFFIVAFTPVGTSMGAYLVTIFGAGGMFIAALLVLVLLGGVLGFGITEFIKGKDDKPHPWAMPLIGLALLLLAAWIFSTATGTSIALTLPGLDSATWTIIFVVVFVLLVIWYATGGKAPEHK
jgi:hypothetical protein